MKNAIIVILLALFPILVSGQANEQQVFDNISKALRNNQPQDLADYYASSVECDILGQNKVYSKAQASAVIKDFFTQNKSKSFTVLHQSGKNQVKFIIGTYVTVSGKSYRTSCFVKNENDSYLIHQIRIENETGTD